MITIRLNEIKLDIEENCTLHQLLIMQQYTNPYFAVAVNKEFIPRAKYTTSLKNDDWVEIITPMQGG